MRKLILTIVLLGIVVSGASAYCFAEGNLLRNPSFEQAGGANPEGWETWMYKANGSKMAVENGEGHIGTKFISITSDSENDARYKQTIAVKENSIYKLSCWAKTENVGMQKSGAFISVLNYVHSSKDLKGTVDKWTYLEMYAKIGPGISTVDVTVSLGGHGNMNTGKAYFDDISVEEVTDVPQGATLAQIAKEQPQDSQTGEKKSGSSSLFIILLIAIAAVVGVAAYFIFAGRKNKERKDEEDGYEDSEEDGYEEDDDDKDDDSYLED